MDKNTYTLIVYKGKNIESISTLELTDDEYHRFRYKYNADTEVQLLPTVSKEEFLSEYCCPESDDEVW